MTAAAYAVVVNRLTSSSGNAAYCGSRVYPHNLPQNPILPSETYQVISAPREHAMGIDPGTVHARVQVDIYDSTYLGTVSGGKRVRDALSRWSGTATGVTVHDVFIDNERDAFVEQLVGGDRTAWRRSLDFIIHYEE